MTDFEKGLYFLNQKDTEKAILCFKKSARDGNVDAMNNLASLYLQAKDYQQAINWYKQAVEAGCTKSASNLAILYEMTKEYDKAIKIYKALAIKDHKMLCKLGSLYYNGLHDVNSAIEAYSKASTYGQVDALSALGEIYEKQGDIVQAKTYYTQGAHDGDPHAMFLLGNVLYRSKIKDVENAEKWWGESAEAGNEEAYLPLGRLYRYDLHEYVKAFEFFDKAAEQGNVDAMVELGKLYETVLANPANAIKWYRKACDAGNVYSMICLGMFYYNQPDYYDFITARNWLTKAYQAGDIDGLVNLGYIYFYDENNKNTVKAIDYLEIAARKGAQKAFTLLGTIYSSDYTLFDYDKAIENLELALPADDSGVIHFQLANIYGANRNTGRFLEFLEKACERGNVNAQFTYGRLLCDSSFIRYDVQQGVQLLEQSSHGGCIEATKLLSIKYSDKRSTIYDETKAEFYYGLLITQIVKESQDFETVTELAELPREELVSIAIALIERIGKRNLY